MKKFLLRSGLLLIGLALGIFTLAWWRGFDLLDLMDLRRSWRASRLGYHAEMVDLPEIRGKPCRLSILRTPQLSPRPVLFLHGFGDNKFSGISFMRASPDILAIDWPRHGASDCEGAQNLSEVAQAIEETLRKLKVRPRTIVGVSLGVPLSSLLSAPEAQFVWISPPFLDAAAATELLDFLQATRDLVTTRNYMGRILSGGRQFPDAIYYAILKRKLRADPLLLGLDFAMLKKKFLAIAPERAQIYQGQQDLLTPHSKFDKDLAAHFARQTEIIEGCAHDLIHGCMKKIGGANL